MPGGLREEESTNELRKKMKISKENHSEIERRRRLTMNNYISQLSELFLRRENIHKKLNRINVLKYAASYLKKLKETESIPHTINSLSFISDDEIRYMMFDSLCGFTITIKCDSTLICEVSKEVEWVLGCKQDALIGASIFNLVHMDDYLKIYDHMELHKNKNVQVFDFKQGVTSMGAIPNGDMLRHRKFALRIKCFSDQNISKNYFCPNYRYTYNYHNYKFSKSLRIIYGNEEYILLEFTGVFTVLPQDNEPVLRMVAYVVEDFKNTSQDNMEQINIKLTLDGIMFYYDQNDDIFVGYKSDEIVGTPFALFIEPEYQNSLYEIMKMSKSCKEATVYFLKLQIINKNSTKSTFKIYLKCVFSVFTHTPEYFNLFLELDLTSVTNPGITIDSGVRLSIPPSENISTYADSTPFLIEPSLSPLMIYNVSPSLSPVPSSNFLGMINYVIIRTAVPGNYSMFEPRKIISNLSHLDQLQKMQFKYQTPNELQQRTTIPFNYVQHSDQVPQNMQMFYPTAINYDEMCYKNYYYEQVAINPQFYPSQYTDYNYIQNVAEIPQTFYVRGNPSEMLDFRGVLKPNYINKGKNE